MQTEIIIPAFNEEASIAKVLERIPKDAIDRIIVVDNGSTDSTPAIARSMGVHLVHESRRGYGSACLRGISEAQQADILLFLDADLSDDPRLIPFLVEPILRNEADLVLGSRVLGKCEKGALHIHARWGNWLTCKIIDWLFGQKFTDLGPFRAIRKLSLDQINMQDPNYGWTVEMQVKAILYGLRWKEIPVPYKRRIGHSKISGTLVGSMMAGGKIMSTVFRLWFQKTFFN